MQAKKNDVLCLISVLEPDWLHWVDCNGLQITNYWKFIANEQAGYPTH